MRFALIAASLAAATAVSASAQVRPGEPSPAVFNFTVGSNTNVSDGNARIYSASTAQLGTFNVRVTAWSLEKVNNITYIRDSKLMVYTEGFGVISGDDGDGSDGRHTLDNSGRKDFIVLQFDRDVKLTSLRFTTFSVSGNTKDSDATIMAGKTNLAYTAGLTSLLNDKTMSVLGTTFNRGSWESLGTDAGGTRDINPDRVWGNIWLIGSSFANSDGKIDGFKLTNLAVIPEPASWAMMIGGFGFVGAAARRRNGVRVTA